MNTASSQDVKYAVFKAARSGRPTFINMADSAAVEGFRSQYGNQDLLVSTWYSAEPDISAQRTYFLHFYIVADTVEKARISTLGACFYINEYFGISQENMEIRYTGGGAIGSNVGGNDTGAGQNDSKTSLDHPDHAHESIDGGQADPVPTHVPPDTGKGADQQTVSNVHFAGRADGPGNENGGRVDQNVDDWRNNVKVGCSATGYGPPSDPPNPAPMNEKRWRKGPEDVTSAAAMVILVPPTVFGGRLTPRMNYQLARQMLEDELSNIDTDRYVRDSYVALPNSVKSATGRFVIDLTPKELLYMDGTRIAELSKQPRPEDSMSLPQEAPDAVEWFAGSLADFEKEQHRQNELQKLVLEDGWQIPCCVRRLLRLCLYDHVRLEAYRTIAQFLSWIGAGESEIQYQIHSIDRRNPIKDYQRLNNIVTFAIENPWFVGCEHTLLSQFCPAGGCFMAELIDQHKNPLLFREM